VRLLSRPTRISVRTWSLAVVVCISSAQDTVSRFYEITKGEIRKFDLMVGQKDREMETMHENHRVEVKVYEQKVKHLDYEHRHALKRTEAGRAEAISDAEKSHGRAEDGLRSAVAEMRARLRAQADEQAADMKKLRDRHTKAEELAGKEFRSRTDGLRREYEGRMAEVRSGLELRLKVEVHEVEERKNQHIYDLTENHRRDFAKMREFYNMITKKNVLTIQALKAQIRELQERQIASQALMVDIAEENKNLANPLAAATDEVLALRADLRDAEKDRLALRNARSRLRTLQSEQKQLVANHAHLEARFSSLEGERDRLYDSFEEAVRAVHRRAEFRNEMLERRLDELQVRFDEKHAQIDEVVSQARLDPRAVAGINHRVHELLEGRNAMIRDLQFAIARASKAYNDATRVYSAKLDELGIATEDLGLEPLQTATTTAPAGLVAKPAF